MHFALFDLFAAILALKRPYLTLDPWVRRSPHEVGLSLAMWTGDRLNVGLLNRGGFFPRFNQFCHAPRFPLALSRAQPLRLEIQHRLLTCRGVAATVDRTRIVACSNCPHPIAVSG